MFIHNSDGHDLLFFLFGCLERKSLRISPTSLGQLFVRSDTLMFFNLFGSQFKGNPVYSLDSNLFDELERLGVKRGFYKIDTLNYVSSLTTNI